MYDSGTTVGFLEQQPDTWPNIPMQLKREHPLLPTYSLQVAK